MATQRAIEIKGPRDAQLTTDRHKPSLRNGYILVKTVAIALNPTDWKHIDFMPTAGALPGCDYAGIVEEVGTEVDKPFKKGDRVCGFIHGANALQIEDGAFAEYIVAKASIQMAIPEHMTFETAATLGVAVVTVGQALYQSLQLPLPNAPASEPFPVLIYGGSTATGTIAIQFAKLSGATVITTCSPRNNELVKALGADAIYDYRDEACGEEIRAYTSDKLVYALDCISEASSPRICADALSTDGALTKRYSSLLGIDDFPRDDVDKKATIAYSAIGEDLSFPGRGLFPAKEEDLHFMTKFIGIAQELLAEGKIKPHPVSLRPGGLKGVLDGLQDMREGKVSGEKLVYRIDETP
ncbi:MAG: hypothetical protein HETSPECPRED_009283 [Heterodermia speciosa]|uniref:Enoyl reductase (ER) domain-containing protein n=1 Tax=Heterodermia speciosa TaxID=116794 RepID=A0A8H3G4F2_9LECA|nr:MAG: hypothetical protein HETSPECPRED_009283 [Heterodermia speciosa]